MNYYDKKILEAEKALEKLKSNKENFKQLLMSLKIGDEIYEEQARWMDYDYHPQIIMEIDLENLRVKTYEKSINETKWRSSFHIYNKEKKKFEWKN